MPITLPTASVANTDSNDILTAKIAAAETTFIATVTVQINNAISNNLFQVEPFIIPYLNIPNITTYFQGLGYTVLFPIISYGPNYCWPAAGFPEVIPPGWLPGGTCGCGSCTVPRIQISWPPFPVMPPFP